MDLIEKGLRVADGTQLKIWHTPIRPLPWLISVHGIAEHSGRHHYLLDLFQDSYNIIFFDLRGHGRSEGKRGDIEDFDTYRHDLIEVIQWARQNIGLDNYAIHAHSMGSLIAANFIQQGAIAQFPPTKVFLSAPPAGAPGPLGIISDALPSGVFRFLAKFLGNISGRALINNKFLSHDPEVEPRFNADPLNILDPSLRLVFLIAATYKKVFCFPLQIHFDFMCAIGSEDCLVTTKNITEYFQKIESKQRFVKINGGYHELHNEVPAIRDAYFKELKSFF